MPLGIGSACSTPGPSSWNEAIIEKIGTPSWYACVRRVENDRPSWIRSTAKVIPAEESPGRRKYPCIEWTVRPGAVHTSERHRLGDAGEDVLRRPGTAEGKRENGKERSYRIGFDDLPGGVRGAVGHRFSRSLLVSPRPRQLFRLVV